MKDYDNFFLPVTDLNKAKKFYHHVLGLPIKFDFAEKGMIAFQVGNQEPALIVKDVDKFSTAAHSIWFVVDDVKKVYGELGKEGVEFLSEPFLIQTGLAVELKDPFGNRLGLTDYSNPKDTMVQDTKFTAPCGLFCHDCIPSNTSLFTAVAQLETLLTNLHFDDYARVKEDTNDVFKEYPTFIRVLREIKTLQCRAPCQEGGGNPSCAIKRCVQNKNFNGCWNCPDFMCCGLLTPLKKVHGGTIDHNLTIIGCFGHDKWGDKRGKHYPWS